MDMVYPMFTLVLWTFIVMFILGGSRLYSVFKREVKPQYYRLFSGEYAPDYVLKPSRNFSNLLEIPVLFYVVGILFIVSGLQRDSAMMMAWSYVALRVVHSLIHLSYNHPLHRLAVFAVSGLVLLAMWIELIVGLSAGAGF